MIRAATATATITNTTKITALSAIIITTHHIITTFASYKRNSSCLTLRVVLKHISGDCEL